MIPAIKGFLSLSEYFSRGRAHKIEFAVQIPKIRGYVPRIFDFEREKVSV